MSSVNEIYQHCHHTSVVSSHAKRTAETEAAFFLPYLKPGMRLLDVGCGPGSITVGLALRVEPAPTIGMDASESVIETARSLAKAKPARYLTFDVGNIYEPHFPAESFDAIFAHQVLSPAHSSGARHDPITSRNSHHSSKGDYQRLILNHAKVASSSSRTYEGDLFNDNL